jgi:pimeloyl-ACP methyl ester carboxylesterase
MNIEEPLDQIIERGEEVTRVLKFLGEALRDPRRREEFIRSVQSERHPPLDRNPEVVRNLSRGDLTYAALCDNFFSMVHTRQMVVMALDNTLSKENPTQEEVDNACDNIVESTRQIDYLVERLDAILRRSSDSVLQNLPLELHKHLATTRYVYDEIRTMMKYGNRFDPRDSSYSGAYDKAIFEDPRSREKLKEFSVHMKQTIEFLCGMKIPKVDDGDRTVRAIKDSQRDSTAQKSKELILFVHGLGGHPCDTWGHFPELIGVHPEIHERFNIALFSFPTMIFRIPLWRKAPKIQELAASLDTYIRYCDHDRVNLVCHSLGGLIARRYLIEEVKRQHPLRVPRLALFAVPNNGSDLARVADLVSWRNQQLRQLRKDADIVEMMNQDWSTFRLQEKVRTKFIVGTQDAVVDRFSAARSWDNQDTETINGEGHRSIVKPESASALAVKIVYKLLLSDSLC